MVFLQFSALIRNYGDVFYWVLFFTAETLRAQRAYLFAHREMTMDKKTCPCGRNCHYCPMGLTLFVCRHLPANEKNYTSAFFASLR